MHDKKNVKKQSLKLHWLSSELFWRKHPILHCELNASRFSSPASHTIASEISNKRDNPLPFQTLSIPAPSRSQLLGCRPAMNSPDHSGHFQLFRSLSEALLTSLVANQWFTFLNARPYYTIDTILCIFNSNAVPEPIFLPWTPNG